MNKKVLISIATGIMVIGVILFFLLRRSDLRSELQQSLNEQGNAVINQSQFLDEIKSFYADRDYLEVWFFNGSLSKAGDELIDKINEVKYDGLIPADYHLKQLTSYASKKDSDKVEFKSLSTEEKVNVELLLTDAFFQLASDLDKGKIDPVQLDSSWKFERPESVLNYTELLNAIASGSAVENEIEKIFPNSALYIKGRKAIKKLYEIKAKDTLTWELEEVSEAIEVGDKHPAIPSLRQRLIFWEFLSPYDGGDELLFDSTMWEGLKQYQEANGMKPDGVIGSLAAESLNHSPAQLIEVAAVNMERLRWLPEIDWQKEMILVNVANYQLDYLTNMDTTFSAKVIVGKEYNESPTFSAPMSYIVFSPYWNIPPSITKEEIIPAVQNNKNYLEEKNMEVVTASGDPVKASQVDWTLKDDEEFPFRVRQKPGGDNSLGRVKFMFPNKYNIYIHDTPARSLFQKETRALSHGCIRIENPDQFAKILLKDKSWTDDKIQGAMNQEVEEIVELDRRIPVVILYLTFWAEDDGRAHFRPDVYNRDKALLKALKQPRKSTVQET